MGETARREQISEQPIPSIPELSESKGNGVVEPGKWRVTNQSNYRNSIDNNNLRADAHFYHPTMLIAGMVRCRARYYTHTHIIYNLKITAIIKKMICTCKCHKIYMIIIEYCSLRRGESKKSLEITNSIDLEQDRTHIHMNYLLTLIGNKIIQQTSHQIF